MELACVRYSPSFFEHGRVADDQACAGTTRNGSGDDDARGRGAGFGADGSSNLTERSQ